MKSIGILTTISANHGSCIFNHSLNAIFKDHFPLFQTRFIRYRPWDRIWYEPLRALKPNKKSPLYNLQRYRRLLKDQYRYLDIDRLPIGPHTKLLRSLIEKKYDALVAGKDIWDVSASWHLPKFPNLFWLSEKIPAVKLAYAVSAHRMDVNQLKEYKNDIKRILDSYAIIGVRDDFTLNMIDSIGVASHVKVYKVPDPAFLYTAQMTETSPVLKKFGIRTDRPLLGLLLYGKPEFSKAICQHYQAKGYQIINFNMLNPFVDINIGHKINSYEWAALFKHLNFCITDRFHCSVFCIKTNVPFVSIEPFAPKTLAHSKIFDLLKDFGLTDCYQNTYHTNFRIKRFLAVCREIESGWEKTFQELVKHKYDEAKSRHGRFLEMIRKII